MTRRQIALGAAYSGAWAAVAAIAMIWWIPRGLTDRAHIPLQYIANGLVKVGEPEDMWLRFDWFLFVQHGETALRDGVLAAYTDHTNAAGPLQILADALINRWILLPFGNPVASALVVFAALASFGVALVLAWRSLPGTARPAPPWWTWPAGIAYLLLLVQVPGDLLAWGHPWQVAVLFAWTAIALLIPRAHAAGRAGGTTALAVGGLFFLATALEPWAILGLPLVLLGRRVRDVAVLSAVSSAACLAALSPLLLGETHSIAWRNPSGLTTLWSLLGVLPSDPDIAASAGAGIRVAQTLLILGAGIAFVWVFRSRTRPIVLALLFPVFAVGIRCAFEVTWWPYYLSAAFIPLAAIAFAYLSGRQWAAGVVALLAVALCSSQALDISPFVLSAVLAASAVLLAWLTPPSSSLAPSINASLPALTGPHEPSRPPAAEQ